MLLTGSAGTQCPVLGPSPPSCLLAFIAAVLFSDAAYFVCVDSVTRDMLMETETGEVWGCGALACPSGMACMVRVAECTRDGPRLDARNGCLAAARLVIPDHTLVSSLLPAGVQATLSAADKRLWQHRPVPALHVPSGVAGVMGLLPCCH